MSDEAVAAAVRMVESGWPQKFNRDQALMYLDGLSDLDGSAVQRAVRRLVRVCEFRPTVAAIRREVVSESLPGEQLALSQASDWLRYRASLQFVNGSGYAPVEPVTHFSVIEACRGLSMSRGWEERFLMAWSKVELSETQKGLTSGG